MSRFCLPNGIARVAKTVVQPTISSVSTTHCVSVAVDWFARHVRSQQSSPITSALSGISFTTITLSVAPNAASLLLHDYLQTLKKLRSWREAVGCNLLFGGTLLSVCFV
jgi:hypothetical protein